MVGMDGEREEKRARKRLPPHSFFLAHAHTRTRSASIPASCMHAARLSARILAPGRRWHTGRDIRRAAGSMPPDAAGAGGPTSAPGPTAPPPRAALPPLPQPHAPVLSETTAYARYLTVTNRTVALNGPPVSFDVVSHPRSAGRFVVVFPYHPADPAAGRPVPAVTLVREFAQGPNALVWTLPAGGFEPAKHANLEAAGRAELAEEAGLGGGEWTSLLPADHPGLPEVKWCANRFTPLLCYGPAPLAAPPPQDAEECIVEVVNMPVPDLVALLRSGADVLGPAFTTAWLALEALRELGEPV